MLLALIIAVTFALTLRICLRRGADLLITIALLALSLGASMIHLFARPHVLSWLFTVIWFEILDSSQAPEDSGYASRRLWLLPVLMLFWVNLHGGFRGWVRALGNLSGGRHTSIFPPIRTSLLDLAAPASTRRRDGSLAARQPGKSLRIPSAHSCLPVPFQPLVDEPYRRISIAELSRDRAAMLRADPPAYNCGFGTREAAQPGSRLGASLRHLQRSLRFAQSAGFVIADHSGDCAVSDPGGCRRQREHQSCPGIQATLLSEMAGLWFAHGKHGTQSPRARVGGVSRRTRTTDLREPGKSRQQSTEGRAL